MGATLSPPLGMQISVALPFVQSFQFWLAFLAVKMVLLLGMALGLQSPAPEYLLCSHTPPRMATSHCYSFNVEEAPEAVGPPNPWVQLLSSSQCPDREHSGEWGTWDRASLIYKLF